MSEQVFMFFDLETGGLNPKDSDILTGYFGFFNEELKLLDELELKLKPDNRLPMANAGALKVNGINLQDHLADPETVTYSKGRELLLNMAKKYLKKQGRFSNLLPSGFNITSFDVPFIKEHLIDEDTWNGVWHYKHRDVMADTEFLRYCGWLPKDVSRLTQCADYFGVAQGIAHTARADTLMTVELLKKLRSLMDSKKAGGQAVDLIALLESE